MGVDVSIFAKKSGMYLYGDRYWAVYIWNSDDKFVLDLQERIRDPEEGLNREEAIYFLNKCIDFHKKEEPEQADYVNSWVDSMIQFVERFPQDTFFLMNTHQEEYYELTEQYQEFAHKDLK
jgi:hypothetical protein